VSIKGIRPDGNENSDARHFYITTTRKGQVAELPVYVVSQGHTCKLLWRTGADDGRVVQAALAILGGDASPSDFNWTYFRFSSSEEWAETELASRFYLFRRNWSTPMDTRTS
jgi:hypothetical protein